MKKLLENSVRWVGILCLGVALGVTIKVVGAWVEPNQMPPGGNIAAPFNTGNVGQSKIGGLTLNIGGATYGLIVDKGLVGIKTTDPQADLDVNGDIRAHNLNLNDNLYVGGDTIINGNLNVNGTINGAGFVDWSKPTGFGVTTRGPDSTTTPDVYKLCVMNSQYVEVSGKCVMTRNNDGKWTLTADGAGSYYIACSMYCFGKVTNDNDNDNNSNDNS